MKSFSFKNVVLYIWVLVNLIGVRNFRKRNRWCTRVSTTISLLQLKKCKGTTSTGLTEVSSVLKTLIINFPYAEQVISTNLLVLH